MKIRAKLILLTLIPVVLVGLAGMAATYFAVRDHFRKDVIRQLAARQLSLNNHAEAQSRRLNALARLTAGRPDLVKLIRSADSATLGHIARSLAQTGEADAAVVVDTTGRVLAQYPSASSAQGLAGIPSVVQALRGTPASGFEPDPVHGFGLHVAQPVREGTQVVGSIVLAWVPQSNGFLDQFKTSNLVEATLFEGNTRVATTVINGDRRAIGTKIDDPRVLDAVLTNGRAFSAEVQVVGRPHDAVYWPVLDSTGKVTGMMFVGHSRAALESAIGSTMSMAAIAGAGIALLSVVIVLITVDRLVRRIENLRQVANALQLGDTDAAVTMLRTSTSHRSGRLPAHSRVA